MREMGQKLLKNRPIRINPALGKMGSLGLQLVMTQLEQDLLAKLIELEETVKSLPTVNPRPNLQLLFSRLDELAGKLPKESDPNLRHYLTRKSYQKARLLLEGKDAENVAGSCK
jgi:hypothetical protein